MRSKILYKNIQEKLREIYMGKLDLGISLAERCVAYAKASGRSLLQTRPVALGKLNIEGLRYAPRLEGDVFNCLKNCAPMKMYLRKKCLRH